MIDSFAAERGGEGNALFAKCLPFKKKRCYIHYS